MTTKKFRTYMFVATVILLAVVFVIGLLLGRSMASYKTDEINNIIRNNELDTESFLLEQEFIGSIAQNCELAASRISALSSEQAEIGRLLSAADAKEKLGKESYTFLKKKYHLMQVKTYIMFQKLMANCNVSEHVVLYYYSKDQEASAEQGRILDELVAGFDVNVFAVEYNFTKELGFLENSYNISITPTVIIDYDTKLTGLQSYEKLRPYLK